MPKVQNRKTEQVLLIQIPPQLPIFGDKDMPFLQAYQGHPLWGGEGENSVASFMKNQEVLQNLLLLRFPQLKLFSKPKCYFFEDLCSKRPQSTFSLLAFRHSSPEFY